MPPNLQISDFLDPINLSEISQDQGYKDGQIGKLIEAYDEFMPDLNEADLVLVGCEEERGIGNSRKNQSAPNAIREQFYQLYYWHKDVKIADAGNIRAGATLADTYAALKTVLKELTGIGKTVVILGGSHDLTLAQYYTYADEKKIIEATCVDALIDLDMHSLNRSENFLMEMLTGEPNYIHHYNHIGFQSYYVHPHMLETMDKLRFDCFRLGTVKDNIDEMEPVIRNAHLFSFDISAIAHAYAPANGLSPNGFTGEEACILMRYAGLSHHVNTIGIYGYLPAKDKDQHTARQISHMLWYLIDGKSRGRREAALTDRDLFIEYHTVFAELETSFLQSKRTQRWWMQLPDKTYIACSYQDYLLASRNAIPERWLRAQEEDKHTGKRVNMKEIPQYKLDQDYHAVHRMEETSTVFGYNKLNAALRIKDFEIYSSEGLVPSMGPLRSEFYRIGLTIRGSCDVQLGLEHYKHQTGTVNCTIPNQLFSKSNISADTFGYYMLFNPGFLDSLIPDNRIPEEFPFFSFPGVPFFQLEPATVDQIVSLILRIDEELQQHKPGNDTAIRLYLYLILLELKRTYDTQKLGVYTDMPESTSLMIRFRKLVNQHYLDKQQVADYADMLHVTPNHLNRTIKDISGRTASDHIDEMIMQEAKALLKYTDLSVSEIAWRLQFSEPSSFSRFFRKEMDRTPLDFRANA